LSLGANLKRERELRGISLEEISKATKISRRLLESLETDRFDSLPGGIFRKSFLRSYAKYLGMNEEQVLHEYTLAFESTPPNPDERPPAGKIQREPKRFWALLIAGLLALLILGLVYFFLKTHQSSVHESVSPGVQSPLPSKTEIDSTHPAREPQNLAPPPLSSTENAAVQPGTPANALVSTSQSDVNPSTSAVNPQFKVLGELVKKPEPPTSPSGISDEPVSVGQTELTLEAAELTWISVASGENKLFTGMLKPKETKKFSLQAPLNLILGNAGGVTAVVDGQLLAPLGKTGEKKAIHISAQNYKQFLPSTH
jgi:cytoskeleton protein RodZ